MLPGTRLATKQSDVLAALWDDGEEGYRLGRILADYYRRVLVGTNDLLGAAVGISFELPDEQAKRWAELQAATRVVRITDVTREAIRERVALGLDRGYSARQIADGVPNDGYPGLRGLFEETWKSREVTVARTELQTAHLESARERFTASGVVVGQLIHDGEDDEPCARRNGTTVPVTTHVELNHPNCVASVAPVVDEGVLR